MSEKIKEVFSVRVWVSENHDYFICQDYENENDAKNACVEQRMFDYVNYRGRSAYINPSLITSIEIHVYDKREE